MTWIAFVQNRADDALLAAARSTQAVIVESLDRTVGAGDLLLRLLGLGYDAALDDGTALASAIELSRRAAPGSTRRP